MIRGQTSDAFHDILEMVGPLITGQQWIDCRQFPVPELNPYFPDVIQLLVFTFYVIWDSFPQEFCVGSENKSLINILNKIQLKRKFEKKLQIIAKQINGQKLSIDLW